MCLLQSVQNLFNQKKQLAETLQKPFHAASKLAKTTFNKFNPPPPKMALFGGGGKIFGYFHEFLGLEHKKNFGKTLGQSRCFGIIIGRFRPLLAILWLREIQNIWDFHYFWANLATFFFKIQFWPKLVLEPL